MTRKPLPTSGTFTTPDGQTRTWEQQPFDFSGATYDHDRDHDRLARQLRRVVAAMGDTEWHTLAELSAITGDPEASVSARIRDLRKPPRYWLIERQYVRRGLWRYRLVGTNPDRGTT